MNEKLELSRFLRLVSAAIMLFFLDFGKEVLIPMTLSVILSFLLAPLVRRLRLIGLPSSVSVLMTVFLFAASICLAGLVLGSQVVKLGTSLPQYESTIRDKLRTLNAITLEKLHSVTGKTDFVTDPFSRELATPNIDNGLTPQGNKPVAVEVHQPPATPGQLIANILDSVTGPVETIGLVFVMLVFILLERESLRDRFISIIGSNNLRATTVAVDDAARRLSRFFISQFAVNGACGLSITVALAVVGLPQAVLWGVLTGLLRFIPYIGAWIAAGLATLLAFAISPGWELTIATLVVFIVIELLFGHVIEPQLYGHTTGLSPLSVVVAAVFWSCIWGPVGLVLSTPLTLCLVVAGRYISGLNFLGVLLGDESALTLPEKFYQRALAGDSDELIDAAHHYLQRHSVAKYCDSVLIPALRLAQADFSVSAITDEEKHKVGNAIASVLVSLESKAPFWRRRRSSVLDGETLARHLIHERELTHGNYQGPIDVPAGSVILVVGVREQTDELAAEILVRVLRAAHIDARHIFTTDINQPPPDVPSSMVAAVCLVTANSDENHPAMRELVTQIHQKIPQACQLALFIPGDTSQAIQETPCESELIQAFYSYQEITASITRHKAKITS
ncbi:AI-2E family transporter [Undibacterium rugosum]|uniref:AI-2E family transporter n=1 Tax=Undibacterium rugosum TaxID=2762291 RepID=UPI001B81DD87|nr:AI-2E family transporter [Undibacterium rugosum]MBR7777271.1 AI-2E family transporter [Undibacterium rugosum]